MVEINRKKGEEGEKLVRVRGAEEDDRVLLTSQTLEGTNKIV